jgi:hypothetical protein
MDAIVTAAAAASIAEDATVVAGIAHHFADHHPAEEAHAGAHRHRADRVAAAVVVPREHLVAAGSESDEDELPLNSSRSRPCTSFSPPAQIAASSVDPRANVSPVRAHDSGSDSDDVEDDGDIPLRTTITRPLEMEEKKRKRADVIDDLEQALRKRHHCLCTEYLGTEYIQAAIPGRPTLPPWPPPTPAAAAAADAAPPWRSGGAAAVVEMLRQGSPSVRGKKARVSPSMRHAGGLGIGNAASALELTAPTKVAAANPAVRKAGDDDDDDDDESKPETVSVELAKTLLKIAKSPKGRLLLLTLGQTMSTLAKTKGKKKEKVKEKPVKDAPKKVRERP